MALSSTQILFNWNSEAVLKMQESNPTEAMAILQKCIRNLSDPTELLAAQEEQRKEEEARAATEEDASDSEDEDEPEEYKDKWDEIEAQMKLEYEDGSCTEDEDGYYYFGDRVISVISLPVNSQVVPAFMRSPSAADGVLKVFDQAFVTTSLYCDDQPGQECPEFIRSFLLYNMGLCMHQQGKGSIEAALRFYKMALQTLQQSGFRQAPPEDVAMLLLALYNNIGHIQADHAQNIPEARLCVSRIKGLLATAKRRPEFRRLDGSPDIMFFCMNVFGMPDVVFSTAGAA